MSNRRMKRIKKADPGFYNPLKTGNPFFVTGSKGGSGRSTLITGRPGFGFPGAAKLAASSPHMLITGSPGAGKALWLQSMNLAPRPAKMNRHKGKLNPLKIAS